jgi:hypothetical protein
MRTTLVHASHTIFDPYRLDRTVWQALEVLAATIDSTGVKAVQTFVVPTAGAKSLSSSTIAVAPAVESSDAVC